MGERTYFCNSKDGGLTLPANAESVRLIEHTRGMLAQAAEARDRANTVITEYTAGCKHPFFYDEPGHPHDIRHCAACNAIIGTI
jgi:hypothetical protein